MGQRILNFQEKVCPNPPASLLCSVLRVTDHHQNSVNVEHFYFMVTATGLNRECVSIKSCPKYVEWSAHSVLCFLYLINSILMIP